MFSYSVIYIFICLTLNKNSTFINEITIFLRLREFVAHGNFSTVTRHFGIGQAPPIKKGRSRKLDETILILAVPFRSCFLSVVLRRFV